MSIPIGTDGRVLNGGHPDMRVRVEEDPQSTSGYLIYRWWPGSTGHGPHQAFEDRVPSEPLLNDYFARTGWEVEWTSSPQ